MGAPGVGAPGQGPQSGGTPSGSTPSRGAPGQSSSAAGPRGAAAGPPPGLRQQLGRTRDAARRLFTAHRDLAQAEIGDILDEVKGVAILVGIAIAFLLLAGLIIPIGFSLFLGEWLFGSLGWGVLHGPLFLIGVGIACIVAALGMRGGTILGQLLLAVIIGAVVGVVLGLDLTNQGWRALGERLAPGIESGVRPLAVGAGVSALVLAVLGLIVGAWRGGLAGAFAGLVSGAILGAILGAFTAIAFGPRVGAAVGVTVALIAWPALLGATMARTGVDSEALKARFWPSQTIATSKETIEWVRARTPLGRRS